MDEPFQTSEPTPHNSLVGATFHDKEAGNNLDPGSPVFLHDIDSLIVDIDSYSLQR